MKWSVPLDKLARKASASVETVGRRATFQVFDAVQLRSPVDTGRFRGNWQFGRDEIPGGSLEGSDVGGQLAHAQALRALVTPLGGVTYFVNNLPYARRLEYGYSKQAPGGMVRIAALEFRNYVLDNA
jgi:hypothetical protein